MLNLHLLTDSKMHDTIKQRYIIIQPETFQGTVLQGKTEKDQKTRVGMPLKRDRFSILPE